MGPEPGGSAARRSPAQRAGQVVPGQLPRGHHQALQHCEWAAPAILSLAFTCDWALLSEEVVKLRVQVFCNLRHCAALFWVLGAAGSEGGLACVLTVVWGSRTPKTFGRRSTASQTSRSARTRTRDTGS